MTDVLYLFILFIVFIGLLDVVVKPIVQFIYREKKK